MTKLSRAIDVIINDIDQGKYQESENILWKDLLKIDLEDIYSDVIRDNEDQVAQLEYIQNLEEELKHVNALLSKFETVGK